jgi:hypothetical protein
MGPLKGPEFIKQTQWVDKSKTESQRVTFNDLWYDMSGECGQIAQIRNAGLILGHGPTLRSAPRTSPGASFSCSRACLVTSGLFGVPVA